MNLLSGIEDKFNKKQGVFELNNLQKSSELKQTFPFTKSPFCIIGTTYFFSLNFATVYLLRIKKEFAAVTIPATAEQ